MMQLILSLGAAQSSGFFPGLHPTEVFPILYSCSWYLWQITLSVFLNSYFWYQIKSPGSNTVLQSAGTSYLLV